MLFRSGLQNQVIELQRKIKELKKSHKKLKTLKKTPIGLQERIRQLKNINNLSENCGGWKRRRKLVRDYITEVFGLDMHICEERVLLLNETMNRKDIIKLLKMPENHKMRKLVLQDLL